MTSRGIERAVPEPLGHGAFASGSGEAEPLASAFFARPAEQVARELLGARLLSTAGGSPVLAEIVETEAYIGPDDEASHAHRRFGLTRRNAVMFGPPGRAYVYRIYGIHWCLNAVAGPEGFPAAVLIRAARPIEGLDAVRARRPGRPDRDLLRGPGNLARGMGIGGDLDGHPLHLHPLQIQPGAPISDAQVEVGPRIGVTRAADLPLRFWVAGSPWVSR